MEVKKRDAQVNNRSAYPRYVAMKKEVAAALKEAIYKKYSSLLDLATDIDISVNTVKKILKGERTYHKTLSMIFEVVRLPFEEGVHYIWVSTNPQSEPRDAPKDRVSSPSPHVAPLLPTGTVTFLFTDIEGSTRLWEENPETMGPALQHHDALLRTAIETHGGAVFKTAGDAFCAVFATAPQALEAALSALQEFHAATGSMRQIRLKVRMALHTGTAQQRDGDYFGAALNRVARLLAIGHGDQILLSGVTRELCQDNLPSGVSLKNMGEHRLKDLGRPETVFQLLHPELPSEFPPLRSLDNPDFPNNLPLQLTSFIGREKEIDDVKTLLMRSRLVTLTGIGGCGKTRLALQTAADLMDQYPQGIWHIELAALIDPALVASTVASALNIREQTGKSLLQMLIENLKSSRLLLVLDNCEHLLESCAHLTSTLLRSCPQMKVLATSIETLGVEGEHTYQVPSLVYPDTKQTITPQDISQYEAVRLFVDRAAQHKIDFAVTQSNAPALARLCARLDGIPFAIELGAARVRTLSVEDIANRLDSRFQLLTGGSRTALPRHQTLQGLIDWSYDLLTPSEQILLARLSVFSGGWTLAAGEKICSGQGLEEWEVLDLLSGLVEKSLVQVEEKAGSIRYKMLETVRHYAADKLAKDSSRAEVQRRFGAYFVRYAEEASTQLQGADQTAWLHQLEQERDNFRVALDWCSRVYSDNEDLEPSERRQRAEDWLRTASALERFWSVRGPISEGRERLEKALAVRAAAAETYQAGALNSIGILATAQGDYTAALAYHRAGLEIRRRLQDLKGIATSLNNLASTAERQGDYALSQHYLEESLQTFQALDHQLGIAATLLNLGAVTSKQRDHAAARRYYEESLRLLKPMGHQYYLAAALHNLADVLLRQHVLEQAEGYLRESVAIYKELGDSIELIGSLERFATLAVCRQRYMEAARWLGAAKAAREQTGLSESLSDTEDFDRDRRKALDALGEAAFTQCWEQGLRMTLDAAIDEAIAS